MLMSNPHTFFRQVGLFAFPMNPRLLESHGVEPKQIPPDMGLSKN